MRHVNKERILRWLTAAAVLFYVLVPQTGFCSCPDCDCSNKLPAVKEADPVEQKGCCCCKNKEKPVETTGCCGKTADDSRGPCSCSCGETKNLTTVRGESAETLRVWNDLKERTFEYFALPVHDRAELQLLPSQYVPSVFAVFRLPVRLHLLFLVLLN